MSKFKRTLVYALTVLIALPVSLIIGSAQSAKASGLDTQDFGVMQVSGVNGYSVGFGLLGMTASDLKSVKVELFKDITLLSTSNGIMIPINALGVATSLSSPFNINGYFNYDDDGYWTNSGWNGTVLDVPTKAKVTITDNSDITYSGEYGAPTGDPALLLPHDYVEPASLAVVHPEDFGTMRASGVSGYTVGFGTVDMASHFKKIEVKLYEDATLLATTTSNQAMIQYPTATSLSSPFDVNGTFDYVADTSWTYSGWNGTSANIPTKAVIKVTDKMDNTYTVENTTLTGTPLPYMVAEDFGVMQISGVNGYTVGFGLNGITAADIYSVKVELFKGSELLSTSNGVMSAINLLGTATSLSSPFNIDGVFSYDDDGYWSNTGWNGSLSDVPTKAVITLVDSLDARYIAENTTLTGDPSLLLPTDESQDPVIVKVAQGTGKTISIDFNGSGAGASDYVVSIDGVNVWTVSKNATDVYHFNATVSAYRTYVVKVVAYYYGVKVGEASANVEVKAPPVSSAVVTSTTARVVGPIVSSAQASTAPSNSSVTTTPSTSGTTVTPDEQGKIKGDETESDESSKINWTPWIILFILILLAGAATGGYFYWFGGDDEVAETVVRKPETTKPVAKVEAKKPAAKVEASKKKSRRW